MTRESPHPHTILHLVPVPNNDKAKAILNHPDNQPYVSRSQPPFNRDDPRPTPRFGLEIGYHVATRPRPEVIAEVGRNGDLILPGSSISAVQFSFETHPESKSIMFYDRSRYRNTNIGPSPFRTDGDLRQRVLQPGVSYRITAGGTRGDLYSFDLYWVDKGKEAVEQVTNGYEMAEGIVQNPRWARTIDEGAGDLSSWYNTRIHKKIDSGVIYGTTEGKVLGSGAYGTVMKAVDLDSGFYVAVKEIKLNHPSPDLEFMLSREVKTLSKLTHKNIVEYLGATGWGTDVISIYTSLKAGNVSDLLKPRLGMPGKAQLQLAQQMLEALDYLAWKTLCHRDVKPDNILYTRISEDDYLFQLADFGFANHKDLARTYCGSPMFMAPEMYYHRDSQSPKLDVWSLFVTIINITCPAEFNRFRQYEEVIAHVKQFAAINPGLGPMAREDPELRASAAQMLVHCFEGNGLSTPRGRVGNIPSLDDGLDRSQGPSASHTQPVAQVIESTSSKSGRLGSPMQSISYEDKTHPGRAKARGGKEDRRADRAVRGITAASIAGSGRK